MPTRLNSFSRRNALLIALGTCLAAPLAMAAGSGASTEIEARYRLDVERCNTGQTNQDKTTCLQEAGAARDEAKRARLTNHDAAFEQNQKARCDALPLAERDGCMLQMSGQNTTTQGSVGGGGVLRETTITIPGTPSTGVPQVSPSPAPGLTPSPPQVVPAPSLAPTPTYNTAPGAVVVPAPGTN